LANGKQYTVLGTDLALTRYVGTESGVPLESADSWGSLDLGVRRGGRGGLKAYAAALDLNTVSGRQNLAQALILRLLTPLGSLAHLAHPEYGSRLTELIGQLNDATTRNRARLYTLEALAREPRVREPANLTVETSPDQPNVLRIGFSVLPVDDSDPLALALEVAL
jgi:phage baseplate assembly protein W